MENKQLNFVKNGVIRLPPGFRFHPTDEELVVQYLKRKVFACPLPASIIPELNVCIQDPWNLPGDLEQERYFFSTREAKYPNGNRPNRATSCGYWKATGNDKKIVAFRSNQIVGMKKTLVFYRGKPSNGTRTDWIMHEYRLVDPGTTQASNILQRKNLTQNSLMQIGDWVVCRIFLKKRNSKNDEEINEPCKENTANNVMEMDTKPRFIDFMMQAKMNQSPCSSSCSSSASSGLTEEVSSTREYSCSSSSSHEGDNQT